jgi:hypothetical protein
METSQLRFTIRNLIVGASVVAFGLVACDRALPAFPRFLDHHRLQLSNRRMLDDLLCEAEGARLDASSRAAGSGDQESTLAGEAGGVHPWTARDTENLDRAIEYRRALVEYRSALKWKALRSGVLLWKRLPADPPPPPKVGPFRRYYLCVRRAL